MTLHDATESLVRAASALVREHDVADLLLRLTQDATHASGGDAGGLLVRLADSRPLEVLAATDHVAAHLELYQAQRAEGPCVDVLESREPIAVTGREEICARWPSVGPTITDAGFRSAHAFPLVWRDTVLGGLNIFGRSGLSPVAEDLRTAQAFADMLALVITLPQDVHEADLVRRLDRAMTGRVVIEQAKGALAHRLGGDMAQAYGELLARAERDGTTLTATARTVLREAQDR